MTGKDKKDNGRQCSVAHLLCCWSVGVHVGAAAENAGAVARAATAVACLAERARVWRVVAKQTCTAVCALGIPHARNLEGDKGRGR